METESNAKAETLNAQFLAYKSKLLSCKNIILKLEDYNSGLLFLMDDILNVMYFLKIGYIDSSISGGYLKAEETELLFDTANLMFEKVTEVAKKSYTLYEDYLDSMESLYTSYKYLNVYRNDLAINSFRRIDYLDFNL